MTSFDEEVKDRIAENGRNTTFRAAAAAFMRESTQPKYSYNFSWLGRPIIQYPQDVVAMQELVWSVQPDLVLETGIAHGGSLILWSSLLELNAVCGGPADARVVGVDIDIRAPQPGRDRSASPFEADHDDRRIERRSRRHQPGRRN